MLHQPFSRSSCLQTGTTGSLNPLQRLNLYILQSLTIPQVKNNIFPSIPFPSSPIFLSSLALFLEPSIGFIAAALSEHFVGRDDTEGGEISSQSWEIALAVQGKFLISKSNPSPNVTCQRPHSSVAPLPVIETLNSSPKYNHRLYIANAGLQGNYSTKNYSCD